MIRELPLRLRSVEVAVRVSLEPCGPACLLAGEEGFSYALPGGMGLKMHGADGVIRGVLLGTRRGTLIKSKAVEQPPSGFSGPFSEGGRRRALDELRGGRFEDICRPERECECSLEFRNVEGRVAWTPFSMHAPRIAELFPVHPLRTREAAEGFLRSAWRVLSGLNDIGVSHGDPTFYNFLVGPRTVLIDLDQCTFTGEPESAWDQSVFLYSTIAPMLGDFMTPGEIVAFTQTLMPEALIVRGSGTGALVPAVAHAVEHNRSVRRMRSLAMRNRALELQVTETGVKLNARLQEMHRQCESVVGVAGERDRALQAAHAEMERLRFATEERARALEVAHAAAEALRAPQLERDGAASERLAEMHSKDAAIAELQAELERAAAEMNMLRATADERLAGMESKDAAISELQAELERRDAELKRTAAEMNMLRATAGERLAGMESKEAATAELRAELERRDAELGRTAAEMNMLRATAGERLAGMESKEAAIAELQAELGRTAAEMNMLRADAGERLDEMHSKDASIRELHVQAGRLSAELESLTSLLEHLTRDREELTQRIRGFEAESLGAYLKRRWKR